MISRLEQLAVGAGLLIWAAVGVPVFAGDLAVPPSPAWWVAFGIFGAALWVSALPAVTRQPRLVRILLAVQVAAGLAAFVLDAGYGFSSVFLVVSAGAAALLLPVWQTLVVIAGQTAVVGLGRALWDHGPTDFLPVTEAAIFAGFQLFTLAMVESALRERRSRAELAALNVELTGAQARLAESSRAAERLRISRDLHDLMGHQLTALAVNLEVASHLVEGPAAEHVDRCRILAKEMLTDVREVVSQLRDPPLDLETTLRSVLGAVPGLAIHLAVDPRLAPGDARRAEALLRCTQEIVTNTVRHAGAENLWIGISQSSDGILVRAEDDGHGSPHDVSPGNGLTGMEERLAQLGGSVTYRSRSGSGFGVQAVLPTP
jgi:signal transduction histidine kinase